MSDLFTLKRLFGLLSQRLLGYIDVIIVWILVWQINVLNLSFYNFTENGV